MSNWIWAYSDSLSARPGETVALHISATGGTCEIEVARLSVGRDVVFSETGVEIGRHGTEPAAHIHGCNWPEAFRLTVGEWRSGYYEILLTGADGATGRHMLVVKAARPKAKAVIVLATNTYHAYNSWGGANTYAWTGEVEPASPTKDEALHTPAARLSANRPFSAGIMKPASPKHRIVNEDRRGFRQRSTAGEITHEIKAGGNGWDCPAGFTDKWEHAFVAWAEANGIELDYLTDYDLEREPHALDGYKAALFVGHSEYWSRGQREEAERFVDAGGNIVILSGNTCYWQCRWEDDGRTYVAHKARAEEEDPFMADPARRHLTSGLWSSPWTGKPEAQLTGLSFLFGGYHRFGLCTARGVGGYTVWREDHWALEGADLYWGDVFGDDCRLVGYENDGCPLTFCEDGLPKPVPRLGIPENLEIIATAPATLGEPESEFGGFVPPEAWGPLTRAYAGFDSPANRARLMRGHAVMAAFRRGKGEVFNAGTTEWAYGLQAGNPFVEKITRNVLDRFLG
ncbi:N,N-dimethylformamidase beta subunit family domain-containing protein [Parvibaculum sp.]|jgi:hypothetical protein|uniref:N,N-dimethylformamidase beta subunit family domain-containing protein n=1 Tax=Parvibaculum sp. TaxID=2024848 RepID=UPI002FDA5D5A